MLKILKARLRQGHQTIPFPSEDPPLPTAFRGRPVVDPAACVGAGRAGDVEPSGAGSGGVPDPSPGCDACVRACPVEAIQVGAGGLQLDLGRCVFCGDCEAACPTGAVRFTRDYRMATRQRADLVVSGGEYRLAGALSEASRKLFGRSLRLRQVSAGGSGAEEADTNVLTTVVFDLARFGVDFVASPRHADGLLVTGPISENMRLALLKTYEAVPSPRLVIAVGASAISGGPWRGHAEVVGGVDAVLPVDLYVPGFPPHPLTILDGLLRLIGRMESTRR